MMDVRHHAKVSGFQPFLQQSAPKPPVVRHGNLPGHSPAHLHGMRGVRCGSAAVHFGTTAVPAVQPAANVQMEGKLKFVGGSQSSLRCTKCNRNCRPGIPHHNNLDHYRDAHQFVVQCIRRYRISCFTVGSMTTRPYCLPLPMRACLVASTPVMPELLSIQKVCSLDRPGGKGDCDREQAHGEQIN